LGVDRTSQFLIVFRFSRSQGMPRERARQRTIPANPDSTGWSGDCTGVGCMQRGFSLVEVVVAMAIMITATIAVAQLSILAVRANRIARFTTVATALAVQKLEQVQSSGWTELTASPSDSLVQNTDGYCDYLDRNGRTLVAGNSPPVGAVFVRRWAIEPLATGNALVIQVSVIPLDAARNAVGGRRRPEETRIVGIKARH